MNDPTRSLPPDDATRSLPVPDHTKAQPNVDITFTKAQNEADEARSGELSTGKPSIPGYALHETLGEGGMGAVYKATQLKLNRSVALKVIHGGASAGAKERIRFLAEAEAIAAIDHPHVVKVFDFGDAAGSPYLAMEYLPGGTLSERLVRPTTVSPTRERGVENNSSLARRANMSIRDAADLLRKIAMAVQAAHDCQIVHRDLKPSNIIFDAAGEPRVTDFGLAKKAGGGELTATNAIMGTPAYMAPEQAKGESKFVGPAADVWALGVILYECLTGLRPFSGSGDFEVIKRVIEAEPSSIRSVNRSIPPDLELIVQKCLAKDPARRYASAKAFAADLECWQTGRPVSVKAATTSERCVKWVRRNRIATGVVAASVLGVILASVLAVIAIKRGQAAKEFALRADQEAENVIKANEILLSQAKEQRHLLDVLRIKESVSAFDKNLTEYAFDTLMDVAAENRTAAWAFAQRHCEGLRYVYLQNFSESKYNHVSFQIDSGIAAIAVNNRVYYMNTTTGSCWPDPVVFDGVITRVALNPDGTSIAIGCDNGIIHRKVVTAL